MRTLLPLSPSIARQLPCSHLHRLSTVVAAATATNNSAFETSVLAVPHVCIAEERLAAVGKPAATILEGDGRCWEIRPAGGAVSEGDFPDSEAYEEQAKLIPDTRWERGGGRELEESTGQNMLGERQFTLCVLSMLVVVHSLSRSMP